MARRQSLTGPSFYDTVAAGAAQRNSEYLGRLMGYPANATARAYGRAARSPSRTAQEMQFEAMANAAPEVTRPQTIVNPYVRQPQELPRANPASATDPQQRTSTGLGISQRAAPLPSDVRVARGSTNQEANALAARAALESRQRRAVAAEERERRNQMTDRVWSKALDAMYDPRNPIDGRAMESISQQFMEEYGLPAQAPNPVRLLGVNVEEDDSSVALARARDIAAEDGRNPGGYEDRIRLDKDGNVDYSAYDQRVRLDLEDQRERRSLYHELLKTEMDGLQQQYRLDDKPDPSDPGSAVEYRQRKFDYARDSNRLRHELQKSILGINPVSGVGGPAPSGPATPGGTPAPAPGATSEATPTVGPAPVSFTDPVAYQAAFRSGDLVPGQEVLVDGVTRYVLPNGKLSLRNPAGLR